MSVIRLRNKNKTQTLVLVNLNMQDSPNVLHVEFAALSCSEKQSHFLEILKLEYIV